MLEETPETVYVSLFPPLTLSQVALPVTMSSLSRYTHLLAFLKSVSKVSHDLNFFFLFNCSVFASKMGPLSPPKYLGHLVGLEQLLLLSLP